MYSNIFRVGKDTTLRYTKGDSPTAVCGINMAYDVGYGDKKRTGWIEGVLWGKRAEALTPYLTKGQQVYAEMDNIECEAYSKSDGSPGASMKGRVVEIKLVGSKPEQSEQQAPASRPQEQQAPSQQTRMPPTGSGGAGGFDSFEEDEIPFN